MDKQVFDIFYKALRRTEGDRTSLVSRDEAEEALRAIIERYKAPDTAPITQDVAITLRGALVEYDAAAGSSALVSAGSYSTDSTFLTRYIKSRDEIHEAIRPAFNWLLTLYK